MIHLEIYKKEHTLCARVPQAVLIHFFKVQGTCLGATVETLNPSRPSAGRKEKIKLNFYFHTSLWFLKKFYEGLKGLHETF